MILKIISHLLNFLQNDDYVEKVLLGEALTKICMRVRECSKPIAEQFLKLEIQKHKNLNYKIKIFQFKNKS